MKETANRKCPHCGLPVRIEVDITTYLPNAAIKLKGATEAKKVKK